MADALSRKSTRMLTHLMVFELDLHKAMQQVEIWEQCRGKSVFLV